MGISRAALKNSKRWWWGPLGWGMADPKNMPLPHYALLCRIWSFYVKKMDIYRPIEGVPLGIL